MNSTTVRERPLPIEFIRKRERMTAQTQQDTVEMSLHIREQYELRGLDWTDLAADLKTTEKRAMKLWNGGTQYWAAEVIRFAVENDWMSTDEWLTVMFPRDDSKDERWTETDHNF